MKTILVVLDGLGDEEIPALENKTPLQKAHTPTLDKWAKEGKTGLLLPVFEGVLPTSEEGHFSLFGYDPQEYGLGRGIVTASDAGLELKEGDIALRGNFATVKGDEVVDRRASGEKDLKKLVKEIDGIEVDGVKFNVGLAKEHRIGIVMRGKGLSVEISDSDPHYIEGEEGLRKVEPIGKSKEAEFTAKALNGFLEKAHEILSQSSINKKRELPANYILTRGASNVVKLPSFEEKYGKKSACIAGDDLYKQIPKLIGMDILDVEGANGLPTTNLEGKFKEAREAILSNYDFIFIHVKATDLFADKGDFWGKKDFIEKIDENLKVFDEFTGTLVVTSDHSTCSITTNRCSRDIPLLIRNKGTDKTEYFSEKECRRGSLGKIDQRNFLTKYVFTK